MNVANFLRTTFSVEHIQWLLLCVLKREEEESLEQRGEEKILKLKKKMKTFNIEVLPASFGASCNRNADTTI